MQCCVPAASGVRAVSAGPPHPQAQLPLLGCSILFAAGFGGGFLISGWGSPMLVCVHAAGSHTLISDLAALLLVQRFGAYPLVCSVLRPLTIESVTSSSPTWVPFFLFLA